MATMVALIAAIALGGALGAVLRFVIADMVNMRLQNVATLAGFPIATLLVNAIGCFLVGVVWVMLAQRFAGHHAHQILRGFVMIGLLGGFTTFSTFALESLQLLQLGLWIKGGLNIIASLVVCMVAVVAGVGVGRLLG